MEKVLIVGVGDLGGHILEFLARGDYPLQVFVGDINEERARLTCNNAVIGAAHHGKHPDFRSIKIDLFDVAGTTEIIRKLQPTAVINCSVMHTWHLIRKLPKDIYARISSAALGAWLPCQLTLPMNLARAIKDSGVKPYFINTALSCLTNPVLGKIGLAPTIGIGNVDLIAPAVTTYISRQANVPRQSIDLYLVCHHYHWVYPREAGYKPGGPYWMKIVIDGQDVTKRFDTDKVMYDAVKLYPPGIDFTTVSASSAIKNLYALIFDLNTRTHSPGPKGLPGGYPVRLNAKGAEVVLPPELSLEEAIRINERAGVLDGVAEIKEDGTVVFADYTYEIMKEMLGFDCKSFTPAESESRARELMACYKKITDKYLK